MGKKNFLIDVDKCTGCKLCIVACKDEHVGDAYAPWSAPQPELGHFWIDVKALERGRAPRLQMSFLPMLCQHCEDAPCIAACPEDAIERREDGLVWIDPEACNNCGLCQEACPYDVIYMNEELGIAQKCTGCAHRVDAGAPPRCVDVCPHDAIEFGDEDDPMFQDENGEAPLEILHPEFQAKPRVYWRGLPRPWIAGAVLDAESDEIVQGAAIVAVDMTDETAATASSDAFGDFRIRGLHSNRKHRVEIRKDGYEDIVLFVETDTDQDLGTVALRRSA